MVFSSTGYTVLDTARKDATRLKVVSGGTTSVATRLLEQTISESAIVLNRLVRLGALDGSCRPNGM